MSAEPTEENDSRKGAEKIAVLDPLTAGLRLYSVHTPNEVFLVASPHRIGTVAVLLFRKIFKREPSFFWQWKGNMAGTRGHSSVRSFFDTANTTDFVNIDQWQTPGLLEAIDRGEIGFLMEDGTTRPVETMRELFCHVERVAA